MEESRDVQGLQFYVSHQNAERQGYASETLVYTSQCAGVPGTPPPLTSGVALLSGGEKGLGISLLWDKY